MQLETQRLLLKPITKQDWQLFLQLHQDQQVMRFVSDDRSEQTIKARFDARIKEWEPRGNEWLTLTVYLKETGEKLGLTGFHAGWQPYQQAELGFLFCPLHQGKGYAKESCLALLDYIFNQLRYHKAVATVTSGNLASVKLLQGLGFTLEGRIRDNFKLNGKWYDDIKLGLLEDEYLSAQ